MDAVRQRAADRLLRVSIDRLRLTTIETRTAAPLRQLREGILAAAVQPAAVSAGRSAADGVGDERVERGLLFGAPFSSFSSPRYV